MKRYIGLNAHASSCTLAVVGPSGKRLGSHVVERVVAGVRESPGPKSEGTHASVGSHG